LEENLRRKSKEEAKSAVSKDVFLMYQVHIIQCVSVEGEERNMQRVESLAASAVFKSFGASPV